MGKRIPLKAQSSREQQLQTWINQNTEFECNSLEIVSGDASFRRYFRFVSDNQSIIAVDAPPEHEDACKFIAVAMSYQERGLKVPKVFAYDLELGFYIQQDFGNRLFGSEVAEHNCDELYSKALANIPLIQTCLATSKGPLPAFDRELIYRELSLFADWLLDKYLGLSLSQSQSKMLNKAIDTIAETCLTQPVVGVHRDYHSRNLMLLDNDDIGLIDFQDAVLGPITYDAVSLLRDSYQNWPQAKIEKWLQDWHAKYYTDYPWTEFKMWFDCTGMQRQIKIAGLFARLSIRDDKQNYLQDIPRTLNYMIDAATQYPEYAELAEFILQVVLPSVIEKLKIDRYDK